MLGIHDLPLFILSGLLLNMTPGPDSLLITARSATHRWQGGSVAALGIGSGTLIHVGAAALGLSALLATSATAFMIVKLVGAAYLLWIGASMLLKRTARESSTPATSPMAALTYRQIFMQGLLTNLLNPKVALFFLAFVPQFISVDATHKPLAFLLLGLLFNVSGMLWSAALIIFVSIALKRLPSPGRRLRGLVQRSIGALFVALGVRLALTRAQ